MNFQQRIENKINKSSSIDGHFKSINFICVNEFKWSYEQLMKTPIPFVIQIMDSFDKLKKEERKQNKKRR